MVEPLAITENQKTCPADEFERQLAGNNPIDVIENYLRPDQNGDVILALGAVGGNGASSKAQGILREFAERGISTTVVAMEAYLAQNPLVVSSLRENGTKVVTVDDSQKDPRSLYQNSMQGIQQAKDGTRVSGVVCLGPRTYYPFAALNNDLPPVIIDGAVPDVWKDEYDSSSLPTTAYDRATYDNTLYLTTCGFTGWKPPKGTYPENMKLQVVAQPFSQEKVKMLRTLRQMASSDAKKALIENGILDPAMMEGLLIVSTMDQVYLDPKALQSNGGFLKPDQFGQSYAHMTEMVSAASQLSTVTGQKTNLYIRPGIMSTMLAPVIDQYRTDDFDVVSSTCNVLPNEAWLMMRRAADIEVGRAPLCVSTAEALGMGKKVVMTATPGRTLNADGSIEEYMTETRALEFAEKNRPGLFNVVKDPKDLSTAFQESVSMR